MRTTVRHKIRKHKIPRGLNPAIVENILWFSKFTPIEKLEIFKKQQERVKAFRGLALKCTKNISLKK
ncbi:MAG: hypothetical protein Q7T83_06730 [Thermodesulfovibrionales bacterium]|nr:hypothetical protein [Thermodesulfovibrionales bacterium]